MIRLDRYLCEMGEGTRSEVKEILRKGRVCVDGVVEKNPARKVEEESARVSVDGRELRYAKHAYFLLNKPAGLLSASRDGRGRTVLDWMRGKGSGKCPVKKRAFSGGEAWIRIRRGCFW